MNKGVLCLIFSTFIVSNVFCIKAFSQSRPVDETPRQPAGDSVKTDASGDDVSIDNAETKKQTIENPVGERKKRVETTEGHRNQASRTEAMDVKRRPTESGEPIPVSRKTLTTVERPTAHPKTALAPGSTSPAPSSGTGLIIAGSIVVGIGGNVMTTALICYFPYPVNSADECAILTLAAGGIIVAIGLPILIGGIKQRRAYNDWRKKNSSLARYRILFDAHNAVVSWKTEF